MERRRDGGVGGEEDGHDAHNIYQQSTTNITNTTNTTDGRQREFRTSHFEQTTAWKEERNKDKKKRKKKEIEKTMNRLRCSAFSVGG